MVQLIAFIIFILSIFSIAFILYKKIPVLVNLSKNGHHGIKKHELILDMEKKIKHFNFNFFQKQVYLHKFLSKLKVLILKIETKIDVLLHGIRKKAQELDKQVKKRK